MKRITSGSYTRSEQTQGLERGDWAVTLQIAGIASAALVVVAFMIASL